MTEGEVQAFEAANPIYEIRPEIRYSEIGQRWENKWYLIENDLMNPDGTPKTFTEAFPGLSAPVEWKENTGAEGTVQGIAAVAGMFLLMIIISGVSPIFTEEVSTHTEPMLLAARYGRSKLIHAKLLAGIIYATGSTIILAIETILMNGILFGFSGFDVPVQLDSMLAPAVMSYTQYILLAFGLQILGALALVALLLFLSTVIRSALPVIFIGAVFGFIVYVVASSGTGLIGAIARILPPALTMPAALISTAKEPGLTVWSGLPQGWLGIILCTVCLVVPLGLILRQYRRLRKV
jgi:ABC-type transport system involved in multi-copper enzyme maturation permease subunit